MSDSALVKMADMPVTREAVPNVAGMLSAVIEKGVTGENVKALESLVGLYERLEARDAEKAFVASFVELQKELPTITAQTVIPNRGKYEKFEDVMKVLGPLLQKHGFSVSFTNDCLEGRVIETCHVRHIRGHSQSNSFKVRVGRADSDTQADCKAATTAKRNALMQAFNIIIRQDCLSDDSDAANEGGNITEQQAMDLKTRVTSLGMNEASFLKLGQSKTYAEINTAVYPVLCEVLRRKEAK